VTATPADRGGDSAWARLRRRKVVQWGLVYVAAAWGFLQGLEYVTETFHWPEQLRQVSFLALLIGLPIVLVLAWYHGDRGQQRISTPEFAILTLLLLLGGGAFWYYQRASEAEQDAAVTAAETAQPPASPAVSDARPSVAVLPFENRSRDADDAFFVDGIHDDILTQLSKVSALRVISRTSVEQFRGTKLSMRAIAEQLGVTKILEGGVQRGGDRVRINVQLIDASTDAHLWAETYDRELTAADIFAIQSDVAAAIAGALKATLTAGEKASVETVATQNLEAWEAYQLGKQRMAKRTSGGLAEAERFFREAIELDPSFALAHVGLADDLRLQTEYSGAELESTLSRAEKAIAEALTLNPNLAEALVSKAGIATSRGQDSNAERLLLRAIELNPNYVTAHHWLGIVLSGQGRNEEAYKHTERAVQLDPLSAATNGNLANLLEGMGRFDEAEKRYRRMIQIDPMSPLAYASLATHCAYARNRFMDAVLLQDRAVALDSDSPIRAGELALFWLDMDDEARATDLVESISRRWPDDFYANSFSAAVAGAVGDNATAEAKATKALVDYPASHSLVVAVLRNSDLRRGDFDAARARYAAGYPELLSATNPRVSLVNVPLAVDLSLVFQRQGNVEGAKALLDASDLAIRSMPRLGFSGYGIADAQIHALRLEKAQALVALREAERVGWRGPAWRYYRDIDPNLASIRNEPEFKAVFADIERDMARQRAALAARPKDAPLELAGAGT
jgi:TolB-like protein/Flp pilus assembly protein TadD